MPWYDQWGWASETEIPGRFTSVPLPADIPQGHAANWTGYAWVVMAYSPPPVAVPSERRMTKLAFRNRFSATEKENIELASCDNPAAPTEQRRLAASLRANLADQRDARYISPDRDDTRTGVFKLEQFGLIGPGRALEILDAPISEAEAYRGE